MIPTNKVREIISRHKLLEKELSSDKIDKKNFAKISKEYSDLNEILTNAEQYLSFEEIERDLNKIINDNASDREMIELAKLELDELHQKNLMKKIKIVYFQR